MKRRQAGHSKEKGAKLMRLRTADIYGGMIPSRLREDETLPALAQSIARHGLLQPIVCRKIRRTAATCWCADARRLAACRMLGLEEIDAVNIPGTSLRPSPVFWRSISRGRAFRFWKRRGF
ncbi:MAG: ParB N-terminal domain-containing protein [Christensenellales bacterium]